MARPTEIPELIKEFTDMSKEYLRQETLEPAKQLGRYAGFAIGAALSFAIGTLLLAVAGLRLIVDAMPDGPNWSAFGYVVTALILAILALLLVRLGAEDRKRG